MKIPVQVTFRNVEQSSLVMEYVRSRAEALERYLPRLIGCKVIVEEPHRRHHEGRMFHVRIDMTVPGAEIVVGRDPAMKHAHEDVLVAIRDAFDAARRRLEDYSRRRRGLVRRHAPAARTSTLRGMPKETIV